MTELTKSEAIKLICDTCRAEGVTSGRQQAYILATVQHETKDSFQPVREAYYLGSKAEACRKRMRYYPWYGRGYVQLTWERNYKLLGRLIGVDLIADPDLAMEPVNAAKILVIGFRDGLFTGKKISDYIDGPKFDTLNARRCINGMDKAEKIRSYVHHYLPQ